LTGFARVTTRGEAASVGLSAADLFPAELLNVIEAGDTQRSKHIKPTKWAPIVEADTSKDFLYEGERQALLFCTKVECDVKCKSLLISRPANQRGLRNANSTNLRVR
jgi:hypothetical protein